MRTILSHETYCGLMLMLASVTLPSASAQERAVTDVGRFLDDASVAVVIVDLEQLDMAALAKTVGSVTSEDRSSTRLANSLLQYFQPALSTLRDLGADRVYAVYSLHDVTQPMPYLVVPTANDEQAGDIARFLETGWTPDGEDATFSRFGVYAAAFTRGSVAIAGSRDLRERLDPQRIPDRDDGLKQALAVDATGAIRVVSVLTEDQRRVFAEMLPSLPEEFGGVTGAQIADGVKWLSLGVDLKQGVMQGQIVSRNEESAQTFAAALPTLIGGMARVVLDEPSDAVLRAALSSVQATADGDRITVSTRRPTAAQRAELLVSLVDRVAPAARNISIKNSLKQHALGMHNFHDVYSSFPPPASYDEAGKPLLSWRVYLLPYLEEGALYREFHLNEPWDSPHNRKLIERMPAVFASEHFDLNLEGKTTLQLPVGAQTPFQGAQGSAIRDITDGTSNTIMIVEVPRERAVYWTQPKDFKVNEKTVKEDLLGGRDQFWAAFCDGSARAISADISEEILRRLLSHQDGEVVGPF